MIPPYSGGQGRTPRDVQHAQDTLQDALLDAILERLDVLGRKRGFNATAATANRIKVRELTLPPIQFDIVLTPDGVFVGGWDTTPTAGRDTATIATHVARIASRMLAAKRARRTQRAKLWRNT